jgi:hypothetical protein
MKRVWRDQQMKLREGRDEKTRNYARKWAEKEDGITQKDRENDVRKEERMEVWMKE